MNCMLIIKENSQLFIHIIKAPHSTTTETTHQPQNELNKVNG